MEKTPASPPPRETIRLMPRRVPFVSGISNQYDDEYPVELESLVAEAQFSQAINQINNTLTDYWPCFFCVCCGYACCLCTGGLSLLCPNMCISDAEQYAITLIERINARPCFRDVDVQWALVKKCGRSWVEISFPASRVVPVATAAGSYQTAVLAVAAPVPAAASTVEATVYGSGDTVI
ncbi:Aste57867_953 [Aphanomyces stellatus]|uniref:Aste57867_953 protein n=1 Tax=Aphanomyces stellatus TaxID=120398 RepID=A0A485K573_9STRA|nr:hypothetical protein As57867_000952 [Aphanomyces stellatus]VFT78176.1 Aste57867_953 [Aphanomyces stellatus]